jgi:hypothetical protein
MKHAHASFNFFVKIILIVVVAAAAVAGYTASASELNIRNANPMIYERLFECVCVCVFEWQERNVCLARKVVNPLILRMN